MFTINKSVGSLYSPLLNVSQISVIPTLLLGSRAVTGGGICFCQVATSLPLWRRALFTLSGVERVSPSPRPCHPDPAIALSRSSRLRDLLFSGQGLRRAHLSVLKISAATFHWPPTFFHTTTYLPSDAVLFPCASLVFRTNVPMS